MIQIKRAYEEASKEDGYRVLVDRLWPRGVRKEDAKLDDWAKELAPSTGLRQWFGHDPEKFGEFVKRYEQELQANEEAKVKMQELQKLAKKGVVTLVYGAKDEKHNNAAVLVRLLTTA